MKITHLKGHFNQKVVGLIAALVIFLLVPMTMAYLAKVTDSLAGQILPLPQSLSILRMIQTSTQMKSQMSRPGPTVINSRPSMRCGRSCKGNEGTLSILSEKDLNYEHEKRNM